MWKPILEETTRKEAIRIIKEVAEEVRDPEKEWAKSEDATLAGGFSGLALFYAYLQGGFPDDGYETTAVQYLEKAVEISTSHQLYPGLYSGTSGVTWTIHHLGADESGDEDDPLAKIDEAMLQYTAKKTWKDDFDLVSGLAGIGVYALEALPKPRARTLLEQIVERLAELSEKSEKGVTWKTPPELLPDWQREIAPKGYYNLGLAHGIPGIWSILAQAAAEGIQADQSRSLLEKSISWFLPQYIEKADGFPSWIAIGEAPPEQKTRYAWCYGEPGIAISLFGAARLLENSAWETEALSIMKRVASAPPAQAGVREAGVCHGSAGLAHILNRFYQATGDDLFRKAAQDWYAKTVEYQEPGKGVAGFRFIDEEKSEHAEPGLLTGAAGIALALLSAAFPVEPLWDRLLMTSLPSPE